MAIPIWLALTTAALHAIFLAILPLNIHADYVLYTGEVLMAGQNLTNGHYRLSMQHNCELVLYNGDYPIWKAETNFNDNDGHDCYLLLKHTGEIVLRKGVHYTLWTSSNKSKKGKYALVLDGSSGKLSVYGQRRWTSNNQKEEPMMSKPVVSTNYVLLTGQKLTSEMKLKYNNYELSMSKCNVAIKNTKSGQVLWQTNTVGYGLPLDKENGCSMELENDGELLVRKGSERLWSTNKKYGNGEYIAVLRFDGRLNVYGPLVWSSDKKHLHYSLLSQS